MTWSGTVSWSLMGVAVLYAAANFVDDQTYGLIGLNIVLLLLMVAVVGSFGLVNSLVLWRPAPGFRVVWVRAIRYAALGLGLLFIADALSGGVGGHAFFGHHGFFSLTQSREGLTCVMDEERGWLAFTLSALIVWAFSAALELFVRSWVERAGARKTATRQTGIVVGLMAAGVLGMSILAEAQSCPLVPMKGSLGGQAQVGNEAAGGSRLS